jgi:ZIP family zinc transporter
MFGLSPVWTALALTTLAGMATGIGSAIAFFAKRTNHRFLSVSTGFSAGVMLYVSFVEILAKSGDWLSAAYGERWGPWANVGAFFGGMAVIGLIDSLIPSAENPHELHSEQEIAGLHGKPGAAIVPDAGAPDTHDHRVRRDRLMRMGLFMALAITIHNFPEGLATFLAALEDPKVGLAIAVAIALHNIPEGISVAVPIFYATGSRRRAFAYSLLSGLAEPVGAVLAYLALLFFLGGESGAMPRQVVGLLFGGVAGVMVYISLDELLPTSRAYGKGHDSLLGLLSGMAVMALSLLMMR